MNTVSRGARLRGFRLAQEWASESGIPTPCGFWRCRASGCNAAMSSCSLPGTFCAVPSRGLKTIAEKPNKGPLGGSKDFELPNNLQPPSPRLEVG